MGDVLEKNYFFIINKLYVWIFSNAQVLTLLIHVTFASNHMGGERLQGRVCFLRSRLGMGIELVAQFGKRIKNNDGS